MLGRDGSVDWLCWPRFDSGALLAALLGTPEHGRWLLAAVDVQAQSQRRAVDRAVRAAQRFGLQAPLEHWRDMAQRIHADACSHGYDARLGTFVQSYGSDQLDASLLLLPLVGFLPASDPRIQGTLAAIEHRLLRDGLVLRYDTSRGQDGLPPGEGAFLPCSFWFVDNAPMRKSGLRIVMATSDGLTTARALGKRLGIDEVLGEGEGRRHAGAGRRLHSEGRAVAMAGDGMNDAPAGRATWQLPWVPARRGDEQRPVPRTPIRDSEPNRLDFDSVNPRSRAAATMAAASGCSLPWSRLAAGAVLAPLHVYVSVMSRIAAA